MHRQQGPSRKRADHTLFEPAIFPRKAHWDLSFLQFRGAFRWRSGSCRITIDSMSKLSPKIRGRRAKKGLSWKQTVKVVRMKVACTRVFCFYHLHMTWWNRECSENVF